LAHSGVQLALVLRQLRKVVKSLKPACPLGAAVEPSIRLALTAQGTVDIQAPGKMRLIGSSAVEPALGPFAEVQVVPPRQVAAGQVDAGVPGRNGLCVR
jgi:hypothetical protein